jgi:hypothetical protein
MIEEAVLIANDSERGRIAGEQTKDADPPEERRHVHP